MTSEIPRLADLDLDVGAIAPPLRVCVVSSEFLGPVKNGGIATATSGLLAQLVKDGHDVTLLYTDVRYGTPTTAQAAWPRLVEALAGEGVTLAHIPHEGDYRAWRRKAWHVREFLAAGRHDLVYFTEHHGSGYYAMAAKRAGISPFAQQVHVLITHGAMEWVHNINDQFARRPSDMEMMGFERRSVEWADVVIGPSAFLLHEYERYGWQLPARAYCQPYPLFRSAMDIADRPSRTIDEIVFFGRLETRKGLWIFCDALERLSERLTGKTVTFLGRMTDHAGVSSGALVVARAGAWPFRVRLLTDLDQEGALAYLAGPGRLAVMPSLADNSPCVVYECMENGIPFLTTRGSGADELVHPDCWPGTMVEPTAEALARKLAEVLEQGAAPAWPRFDPGDNLATWSRWHRYVSANRTALAGGPRHAMTAIGETAAVEDGTAPLFVFVDADDMPLDAIAQSIESHLDRFGDQAGYLVLTARRWAVQDLLFTILNPRPDSGMANIVVLGPDEIDDARETIAAADVAFVADAAYSIQTPFFLMAMAILGQGAAAAVSCVTAIEADDDEPQRIHELPFGDAPTLVSLGFPAGSSVWAVHAQKIPDLLESVELYDEEYDQLLSASAIGQALITRCAGDRDAYRLIPAVGAVRRWTGRPGPTSRRRYRDVVTSARMLGFEPSVRKDAAPWLALSAFGSHRVARPQPAIAGLAALPDDHPIRDIAPADDGAERATFAAALGWADRAVEIAVDAGLAEDEVDAVLETAKESVRLRGGFDLTGVLSSGRIWEPGPDRFRQPATLAERPRRTVRGRLELRGGTGFGGFSGARAAATRAVDGRDDATPANGADSLRPLRDTIRNTVAVYLDHARLATHDGRVLVQTEPSGAAGARLAFVDVPVAGHGAVTAELWSEAQEPVAVAMSLIDQKSGQEIARALGRLEPGDRAVLRAPLHGVFASVAIVLTVGDRPGKDTPRPAVVGLERVEVR